MNFRMRTAMRDALALVRKSNVAAATSIIRAALSRGLTKADDRRPAALRASKQLSSTPAAERKPLGEVIKTLRDGRSAFLRKGSGSAAKASKRPGGEGDFTSRAYTFEGQSLSYMLYVPPHKAGRDLSLVLMLHGCTQNPQDFAVGTQMNSLADEFGLIVAYPEQPRTANSSGCWNWFDGKHQKHGTGEPAMLAGLAKSLAREFNIGATRVFAAGLSAGGAMAEILASTYPREFAAVGIHSGLPYGAANSVMSAFGAMKGTTRMMRPASAKVDRGIRRIVFHGASDATVHPSNGERILDGTRQLSNTAHETETTTEINGRSVTRILLKNDKGHAMAEHWVVTGGGHAWFGGNRHGSYTEAKGPDASREMVRFFLET